jgi:hypothetical protein
MQNHLFSLGFYFAFLSYCVFASLNSCFWKGCNRISSYSRVLFSRSRHPQENKSHAKISDFTVSDHCKLYLVGWKWFWSPNGIISWIWNCNNFLAILEEGSNNTEWTGQSRVKKLANTVCSTQAGFNVCDCDLHARQIVQRNFRLIRDIFVGINYYII